MSTVDVQTDTRDLVDKEGIEELREKLGKMIKVATHLKTKYDNLKENYHRSLDDNERILQSVVKAAGSIMSDPSLSHAMATREWRAWCRGRHLLESQSHDLARALMPPPPRDPKRRKLD